MNRIKKLDYKYLICWGILLTAGFVYLTTGITHETLWYDESYSAAAIKHPIPDIIRLVAGDNHPPLYFIMLKMFCMISGQTEFGLRLFSVFGVLALAALGMGPVKRIFGKTVGLVFAFIVLTAPINLSMAQETRMYTWAAFFVTSCVLYGYLAVCKGNKYDWLRYGIFMILAAYTHYYALLAVIITNILIFLWAALKERKKIKNYLITTGAFALSYLPWAFVLAGQASKVSKDYWIPPLTWNRIINTLLFPFSNKFEPVLVYASVAFNIALILAIAGIALSVKKHLKEGRLAALAFLIYISTILGGVVASYFIRPVFVERYSYPVIALFLLTAAYGISLLKKKPLIITACVLILCLSVPQIVLINKEQFNGPMHKVTQFFKSNMRPDDIFIHTDEHTFGTFCYYFPNQKHYLYMVPGFKGFSGYSIYSPIGSSGSDVAGFIAGKKNIWMVDRLGSPFYGALYRFNNISPTGINQRFELPYSFYAVEVSRIEPGK